MEATDSYILSWMIPCCEPEAVWMQWCIEFWAYPRNPALRWFAKWYSSLSFSVTWTQVGFICNACITFGYLFFLWFASSAKRLTKASYIEAYKNNSAFQVSSTTDHTRPTPLTVIIPHVFRYEPYQLITNSWHKSQSKSHVQYFAWWRQG